MKSKQKIKRKRVKARHQKPSHFGGGLKPFPAWGKLVAILGMTLASGLFLLVSVSAYFADYAGVTLGFNIPTYYFTVDYNSNGGSAVASEDVKVGESITEPTPPTRTGYDFASWHQQADLADTAWQFATNKMPRQNLTLHAKWTAKTYDITYNLDGGTGTGGNPTTYTYDIGVASFAPATGKTGHTFVGWEDENGNPVTSISKTEMGNKTLYARWTPNEYDITYELDGGDNDNSNPAKYTYDIGVSSFAPATGKVGHVFTRWEDENGKPVTSILKTETGNKTLYARWAPTYEITYVLDSGTNPQDNPTQYAYGTGVASFKSATKSGYKFLGWFTESSAGTQIANISTTATGNKTLYAHWEEQVTLKVGNTDPGTEFDFAGSKWRILDTDMDNTTSNGLQALVIKVDPISTSSQYLASGEYYFESTGISNGYERSRSIGGIGKVIDDWYKDNIAGTADEAAVQAVALNNPTYTEFTKTPFTFNSGSGITNWEWHNWYQDTRFATSLTGSVSKQAFALSYGDIHGHMGIGTTVTSTDLFKFSSTGAFRLRSAAFSSQNAGFVSAGNFARYNSMDYKLPVRPSLSLLIEKI